MVMSLSIHLLGRPVIDREPAEVYRFRSQKSWAILGYLLLTERPTSRSQLASLLFGAADDPLRALRWSLNEIRRALGDGASVGGDPVTLTLPAEALVDVDVVTGGTWTDAIRLRSLGATLLEGMAFSDAAAFESWLLTERRHVAAASEAILHEAALASMSRGAFEDSISFAARVVAMNPLEENHQALLIRAYRMAGDETSAGRQLTACVDLFSRELGVEPGPAVRAAMRPRPQHRTRPRDDVSIAAVMESGAAAIAAGALDTGIDTLRTAVTLADQADASRLRASARLALAEALIHSLRGEDEEGSAILHTAIEIAHAHGENGLAARAHSELGYVEFLRARYARAEQWLRTALTLGHESDWLVTKATTYLGSVKSDQADYGAAIILLKEAANASRRTGDLRREAYAESMLGRVHLVRHEMENAARHLDNAVELALRDQWLAFLPWPQAMRGELEVIRGNFAAASDALNQAFARACQLGDPCWEGLSARGLALLADATGDTDQAFDLLANARLRCNRLADTYVWLDVYILDAQCELGLRHHHADTPRWIHAMHERASRTGMRELTVRSLLHRATACGKPGDDEAARLLAAQIDNPALHRRLAIRSRA